MLPRSAEPGESDLHLHQHRPFGLEGGHQSSIELFYVHYANCLYSLCLGKRAKVEVRQAAAHDLLKSEMAGEFVEGFIGPVLDDDERNRKIEVRRSGQTLNRIHGRAITQDRNDLFARPAQRDADRRGQTMAEATACACVKGISVNYWQIVVHG